MNDSDSAALVEKIAGGDASALMTLYDRTNRLLFGHVLRILPENTAAEEALLDAYTRFWRQAGEYNPRGGTPLAWMMAIARTCAVGKARAVRPDQAKTAPSGTVPAEEAGRPVEEADMADVRHAAEIAPPEYIRDLLALRVEREPRAAPSPPSRPVEAAKLELKHASPRRPVAPPPPKARARIVPWLVAAVCAAAAVTFFFLWRQTQKQSEQAIQWERDAAHEARAEAERLRSSTDSDKIRRQEGALLDAALASPGANVIYLASKRPDSSAGAAVFWDTKKNAWIVIGHLPPAPSGKDYQLWFVTAGARKSAGLIPVEASGHVFATLELPPDIPKFTSVELTLEPLGGSEQSASPAVLASRTGTGN